MILRFHIKSAITNSKSRTLPFCSSQSFKVYSGYSSDIRLALRYCSSQESGAHQGVNGDDNNSEVDGKVKPRASAKTKRAKSMARLINSKPWSSDVESSLSLLSPSLSRTTFFQVLRLIVTPCKAIQFFYWAQRMGFAHDHQSYFLMLEILGQARNLNTARNFLFSIEKKSNGTVKLEDRFFNSLIRSFGRAGLFQESIKLFTSMKSIGVSPSSLTFNSLLMILLRRGRTNMAKSLFDEMLLTYGVSPDTHTFNIMIRGFCKNSMVDEGFRFFKEMSRFNCEPDVITYNTLIDGLCRAGKVRIAHNVVTGMLKKCKDLSPDVVTYTTLVRGYCMKQEIDEALLIFKEMINRRLKPNDITCNTLIKGLCEAEKIDKIKEILEEALGVGGFTPDTCTFNILIDAHCKAGKLNEALKVFEKMVKLKVQSDSATYSILIRNLFQTGDLERAEQLFDELWEKEILLSDNGCTPLVAAYNFMFEYLCKNGKTNKAERVFRQLMKRGTQDPPSFKTLIMGHCIEGSFEAGFKLLVLMLRRDFVPDFETYEYLIDGLLQKGKPLLAKQTLEKMLKSSHLPKTLTFHSVLTGLVNRACTGESASLIVLMLESKIRQNFNLSTRTVRLLFHRGQKDRAFQIVGLLYDNGYMVDMEELIGFLCERKKFLEAQKLLLFCLEKHHSADVDMWNSVVEALCQVKRPSEAFQLYYELVEKGNHQRLSCLEDLRTALAAAGRREEAKFVSKRIPEQLQPDSFTTISLKMQRPQHL